MPSRREQWRAILKIAWPLIISNSFWNLQLTIDRIFLGMHSTEALGAAIAVMGVFWVPMALLQQTAAYVATFIAQYTGAGRPNRVGPSFWHAIHISVGGGLLMLLLIPLAEPIFALAQHPASVRQMEVEYFASLTYSGLPTAIVAAVSGFFTGLGQTRVIMAINALGLVGNVVGDYLLIFGNFGFPALGVAGAGYATTLGTWLAALYGICLVWTHPDSQRFALRRGWHLEMDLVRRYLKFGLPSGLQWALEGMAFTVFTIIVGGMANGSAALASSGIAVTIMMLAVLPALGVAQAVSVLVGQHLGEQQPAQAEIAAWSGLQVAVLYILTVGATFLLFPHMYLSWFYNPSDPALWEQVRTIVPYLLMYVAMFICFDSMNMIFSFALKGAGDTRFVSLVALCLPWPLMVVPTWYMRDWDGALYWAWGAASAFIIVQALVFWRRFVGGKWQHMSVIH